TVPFRPPAGAGATGGWGGEEEVGAQRLLGGAAGGWGDGPGAEPGQGTLRVVRPLSPTGGEGTPSLEARARRSGAGTGAAEPPPVAWAREGTRPTRLLAEPRPVVAIGQGGRVTALRLGARLHAVLSFEGPERIAGEWWSAPFDRDSYRARVEGLGDCWIYRDGADGRLYLHGFFD
ncbi:MAG TPA: DNA polymerase Y family protein, partial [Anaeromyxobacteraceae bacterium]|nr:DNA polymerase Y family protein [Anaeromyxobacteraceae bacterium]